jgi:hypothetical protein
MGGWMPYGRVRHRNHIEERYEGFYPPPIVSAARNISYALIVGDLNRMEADYLEPGDRWTQAGPSPAEECAEATGVDVETVRKVLRYVFLESR